MERKLNLKVGQEVIIRYIGRYDKDLNTIEDWTATGIVEKIGKKLIVVNHRNGEIMKFEVENNYLNKNAGSSNYQLYESIEAIKEEIVNHNLYNEIKDKFNQVNDYPFTTDQLERIMSILNE